ncbi:MAG: hypothetical protein WBG86_21550, partial [Polyangiales bacterium]
MSAEFRGTRCYVAWGANRKGRLFRLRSFVTTGEGTAVVRSAGAFSLDQGGITRFEHVALPGGVNITVRLGDAGNGWKTESSATYTTQAGDLWWRSDVDGKSLGDPSYFSPDGEALASSPDGAQLPEQVADPEQSVGWKAAHDGVALPLSTPIVVFGA